MNQKVIILRGLSGSGKTTWSNQFVKEHHDFMRVSRDDIDFMLSMDNYPKRKEKIVFRTRDFLVGQILGYGFNLVLDETYLSPHRVKDINSLLESYVRLTGKHLDVRIQDFIHVPMKQCIERDKNRFFHVGEAFIRSYYKKYIIPLLKNPGRTEWTI